ncbi:hypothetical protein EV122DRAFT_224804 [Schizophyllum commune]
MSAYSPPITASVSVDVEILGDLIFPKGDRKMLPSFAEFVQSTLGMPLSSLPPSSDAQQPRSPLTPPTPSIRPLRAIIYPDCAHRGPIKLTEAADLAQFNSSKTSPSRTMSLKGADMSEILHLYGLDLENDLRPRLAVLSVPIAVCTVGTPTGPCNQVHTNLDPSAIHIAEWQRACAWKDCGYKVPAELGPCAGNGLVLHVITAHYGGALACRLCNLPLFKARGQTLRARIAQHLSSGWCWGLARLALTKGLPVPLPEEKAVGGEPMSHLERA